jgi:DNA-binding LacI/PurR family transcriptional regulator
MDHFRILSGTEQTAAHIKECLRQGRWTGAMPGGSKLATEFGVNAKTIDGALQLLEREGVLVSQGRRKKRMIVEHESTEKAPLRVAILDFDPAFERKSFLYQIQHLLLKSGHTAFFTEKSMVEIRLNLNQVKRLVHQEKADAWVVEAGSREILEWFAEQEFPTFALFGRRNGLPIAGIGPDQPTATRAVVRRLIEQGHSRIVLVTRPSRILPVPGSTERAFLEELENHGVESGPFNLPVWEETIDGLHERIEALIRLTPPTAILVNEPAFFFAVQQHLMRSGFRIPEDISLVCSDGDPNLRWLRPSVAHVSWSSQRWVNRIGRWADNISRGKKDQRQSLTKAKFIEGATIGPAPRVK